MVKVYSKNLCPQCRGVKKFLERNNIAFTEHNIDNDEEARNMLVTEGFKSVPVIMGDSLLSPIVGNDRNRLTELVASV